MAPGARTLLGIIAVAGLMFNTAYATMKMSDSGGPWLGGGPGSGGEALGNLTVSVPPFKLYDLATYDYRMFAEFYSKNISSGEWELYQITVTGKLKRSIPGVVDARDGFGETHRALERDDETHGVFTVYTASSGGEPLTIGGNLDGKRQEYLELNGRRSVQALTNGRVEIDRLPKYNVPLHFEGYLDSFPDVNRPREKSVDEELFESGRAIRLGDNGSIAMPTFIEEYNMSFNTTYNWSAPSAQTLAGYKTLRLNLSAGLLQVGDTPLMLFEEQLWISSDMPLPVQRFTRTNQTFAYNESGYPHLSWIIMETNTTLVSGGYTAGTQSVPWGDPEDAVFRTRHPLGEFTASRYAPASGSGLAQSSFEFGIDDAISEAKKNSSGLQTFLSRFDRPGKGVVVTGAQYNVTPDQSDVNGRAGVYRWNLTFGYYPSRSDRDEARRTGDWNFSYTLVVVENITREIERLRPVYKGRVEIEHDFGPQRGSAEMYREKLAPDLCTLSSSEDILMTDQKVVDSVTNTRTGDINWKDSKYILGAVGLGGGGPGFQLVESLTGMSFPTVNYGWAVQTGTVYEGGHTFSAGVDAETGRLVYVTDIQGTALLGLFG